MAKKGVTVKKFNRQNRNIRLKPCSFCLGKSHPDYKEVNELRRFVTERGKIVSRGRSGICRRHQRELAMAIKRARFLALLPFATRVR